MPQNKKYSAAEATAFLGLAELFRQGLVTASALDFRRAEISEAEEMGGALIAGPYQSKTVTFVSQEEEVTIHIRTEPMGHSTWRLDDDAGASLLTKDRELSFHRISSPVPHWFVWADS